jgi:hypothetical protein
MYKKKVFRENVVSFSFLRSDLFPGSFTTVGTSPNPSLPNTRLATVLACPSFI